MARKRSKSKHSSKRALHNCLNKTRYETEELAHATAMYVTLQEGCGEEGCCPWFDHYKCPLCEGWHITRRRE